MCSTGIVLDLQSPLLAYKLPKLQHHSLFSCWNMVEAGSFLAMTAQDSILQSSLPFLNVNFIILTPFPGLICFTNFPSPPQHRSMDNTMTRTNHSHSIASCHLLLHSHCSGYGFLLSITHILIFDFNITFQQFIWETGNCI